MTTEIFQVAVLFEEPEITNLFSTLINSHGIKTRIIKSAQELLENERIVTEPQYLAQIPEDRRKNSLLIGNKEALASAPGITLARPLTENKIIQAIHEFLS
jgi:hypothetical protein